MKLEHKAFLGVSFVAAFLTQMGSPSLADEALYPRDLQQSGMSAYAYERAPADFRSRLRSLVHEVGHGDPSRVVATLRGGKSSRELDRAYVELTRLGIPAYQVEIQHGRPVLRVEIVLRRMSHNRTTGCGFGRDLYRISPNANDWDPGFGCSTAASIAAMVDAPGDLYRGRGTDLSDGERAAVIVGEYRVITPKQ